MTSEEVSNLKAAIVVYTSHLSTYEYIIEVRVYELIINKIYRRVSTLSVRQTPIYVSWHVKF